MSADLVEEVVTVLEEREASWKLRNEEGKEAFFPKKGEHGITFSRRNVKTKQAVAEIPEWMLREKGW